ncbi:MAG: KGG domain-containing protein [Alphaproteobacteria bacterium]
MTNNTNNTKNNNDTDTSKRGFASMPKDQVREIASKGGQTSNKNQNSDNE